MKTMIRASGFSSWVFDRHEIVRTTPCQVVYMLNGRTGSREVKEALTSIYCNWFDTEQEAFDFLEAKAKEEIRRAEMRVDSLRRLLETNKAKFAHLNKGDSNEETKTTGS